MRFGSVDYQAGIQARHSFHTVDRLGGITNVGTFTQELFDEAFEFEK